ASPWTARCSSFSREALSTPSFCSNLTPRGMWIDSLPLGPCTSTWSAVTAIFTPCGTGIGLRPIRDIFSMPFLPNLAENLAADFRFAGGAAAHQALRRGQNADAQAAHHGTNVGRAKITSCAGPRYALHAGDHAATIRGVLQEHAKQFARLVLIHQLEGGDVALFL